MQRNAPCGAEPVRAPYARTAGGNGDIYVVNVDGSGLRNLTRDIRQQAFGNCLGARAEVESVARHANRLTLAGHATVSDPTLARHRGTLHVVSFSRLGSLAKTRGVSNLFTV